jgi:hypothetical protein
MAPSAIHDQQGQSHVSGKRPRYVEGALIPDVDEHGDNPVVIRLTEEERISRRTDPQTIQEILKYYHRDGFVVLENAIEDHLVDRLYDRIVEDNAVYLKKPQMRWNQGEETGNISQIPPLTPEWLHRDFYANPHMIRVVENILGPKPELRFSKHISSFNSLSPFPGPLSLSSQVLRKHFKGVFFSCTCPKHALA